jgi:hypothetical protein
MKSKLQTEILDKMIDEIYQSDETEVEIQAVSGRNHKYFGKDFKASCILIGHPAHDSFFGLFYSLTVNKFFIHLIDRSSSPSRNYTKEIRDMYFTKWLKSKMVDVAKSQKSHSFPFELILEGLKAKV